MITAKSKPQYVTRTEGGGKWTVAMVVVSAFLLWAEVTRWWRGSESHTFAVEKGVSHTMQINLDAVILMKCGDLHVNVQDSSGDRILAGSRLNKDETSWAQWVNQKGVHKLGRDSEGRIITGAGWRDLEEEGFGEEHVHDIVALGRKRAKWARTPKVRGPPDSCRIFGNLEVNKVQGDFHITARGHGYQGAGQHLDHSGKQLSFLSPRTETNVLKTRRDNFSAQSLTFRTLSRNCRLVPTTLPLSIPLTAPSTLQKHTSTRSSTISRLCRRGTAWVPAPSSPISMP
jgi:hypothetical protein